MAIAKRLMEAGMRVIDAPVSGGHIKALAGEITVMASGPDEAFTAAAKALDAVSAKVFRLGSEVGLGSKVKMINQLLAGVHIAATAEALTLAAAEALICKRCLMLSEFLPARPGCSRTAASYRGR